MDVPQNERKQELEIDVVQILKMIWKRAWLVALAGLLAALVGFSYASFAISPTYSSAVMLYINNNAVSLSDVGFSISSSDLTASQSLVNTYSVLLKNRTTLNLVLKESGMEKKYTYKELEKMISTESVNDTEVLRVTVTATDPKDAQTLAHNVAVVLPRRVDEIVEGSSVVRVDDAVVNNQKVGPSLTKYTVTGFAAGVLLCAILLAITVVADNTIHDEEYILQNYNVPVLAKVPNLLTDQTRKYGYYYQDQKYGYYQSQDSSK